MKRLLLFLRCEFKLLMTHKVVLAVALLQPMLMYALMSINFVNPGFDMYVEPPESELEQQFIIAMEEVGGGSSGVLYIHPVIIPEDQSHWIRQFITMETINRKLHVNQIFGRIDSNLIKNFRNRITSSALIFWQNALGDKAIRIKQLPLLPVDIVYIAYFGMAMIPLGIFISAAITSAILTAYDFETGAILELRMSPQPDWQYMLVQFIRIILIGILSAGINIVCVGLISGVWPTNVLPLLLPVSLLALIGGCVGMFAGFITRKALPAFLIALVLSLLNWLFGNAFGLSTGFSGWYENASYLAPNRYMVEILFPHYYQLKAGSPELAWSVIIGLAIITCIGMVIFRRNHFKGELQ